MSRFGFLVAVAAALVLTACGGGGDDGSGPDGSSGPNYITWKNSANGQIIKDGANNSFVVDASSGAVIELSSNTTLSGLIVPPGTYNVILNGTLIGDVSYVPSTTGTQIVEFTCAGPAPLTGVMTITFSAQGWSHICGLGSSSAGASRTH